MSLSRRRPRFARYRYAALTTFTNHLLALPLDHLHATRYDSSSLADQHLAARRPPGSMVDGGVAMQAKVLTCAVIGLEVDIGPGLPAFNIVGLPDASVQEAKERVRAAVKNSGCVFPQRRITVNLASADREKEGSAYDLPIAPAFRRSFERILEHSETKAFLG